MATSYVYSLVGDFTSGLAQAQFHDEVAASTINTNFAGVTVVSDVVSVIFTVALTGPQQTTLDGLVAAHVPSLTTSTSKPAHLQVRDSTQFVVGATYSAFAYDLVDIETKPTALKHSTTNSERIEILVGGIYRIEYYINLKVTGTAGSIIDVDARLLKNGTSIIEGSESSHKINDCKELVQLSVQTFHEFDDEDFITLEIRYDTSCAVTFTISNNLPTVLNVAEQGGASESSTNATNIGSGEGIYESKVGNTLRFKSLIGGTGINIINNANDLTITNTGTGTLSTEIIDTGATVVDNPDADVDVTEVKVTTSGTPTVTGTLGDPTSMIVGTKKYFFISEHSGTDSYKINIVNFVNGNSITFYQAGQSFILMWTDEDKWVLLGGAGGALA